MCYTKKIGLYLETIQTKTKTKRKKTDRHHVEQWGTIEENKIKEKPRNTKDKYKKIIGGHTLCCEVIEYTQLLFLGIASFADGDQEKQLKKWLDQY